MGSHMFQHVRRRLNRSLAHLVHADLVPTVFTLHVSATCNISGPDVHVLRLRSIVGRCQGHWDSDHRLQRIFCACLPSFPSISLQSRIAILASLHMQTADHLFGGPQGSPRSDGLIAASIQRAEKIMEKIDERFTSGG